MAGVTKIIYRGKEIISIDYRNQNDEEMIQTLEQTRDLILKLDRDHLRLVNVEGVSPSASFRIRMRKIGKEIGHVPSKVAIVGLSPTKRVVMNAYNQMIGGGMKLFDNLEDAKKYLIS